MDVTIRIPTLREAFGLWKAAVLLAVVVFGLLVVWHAPSRVDAAGAAEVSGGTFHSCALMTGGEVKCWGLNVSGQLGDGLACGSECTTPVDVSGLTSGVAAVAAGGRHTCALTTTGGVKCWGENGSGQLGDGTTTDRTTPVDVTGLASGVAAIAGAIDYTCALSEVGGVRCWGSNLYGALGCGATCDLSSPVQDVVGLTSGITAVAAGGAHACALTMAGTVQCWGRNVRGGLGDGTTTDRAMPVHVCEVFDEISQVCTQTLSGVAALTAGGSDFTGGHTCALTMTGGVQCWGRNDDGQLGDGTTTDRTNLGDVTSLANGVVAVAAGHSHTCALTTDGGVQCWGANEDGRLGDGTTTDRTTPVAVSGLANGVAAVAAGSGHTCALTTEGSVQCWGNDDAGQLGAATSETCALQFFAASCSTTPVDVIGLKPAPGDVNCDEAVNSIDALVILQFFSALISSLPCEDAADVNLDGNIDPIDALLVLQFYVRLIDSLPP